MATTLSNVTDLVTDLAPVVVAFSGVVLASIILMIYTSVGHFVTGLFDAILQKIKMR